MHYIYIYLVFMDTRKLCLTHKNEFSCWFVRSTFVRLIVIPIISPNKISQNHSCLDSNQLFFKTLTFNPLNYRRQWKLLLFFSFFFFLFFFFYVWLNTTHMSPHPIKLLSLNYWARLVCMWLAPHSHHLQLQLQHQVNTLYVNVWVKRRHQQTIKGVSWSYWGLETLQWCLTFQEWKSKYKIIIKSFSCI